MKPGISRRHLLRSGLVAGGGVALLGAGGGIVRGTTGGAPQPQRTVTLHTEEEARAYLAARQRSSRRFARAQQRSRVEFESRGYSGPKHCTMVSVSTTAAAPSRTPSAGVLLNRLVQPLYAQSEYGTDGYLVFTTWNDSGTSWVGNLFLENTSYNAWSSTNQELDTGESSSPVFDWETGIDADGGVTQSSPPRTWQGVSCHDPAAIAAKINRRTWELAWPGIIAAGWACWLSGPGWPGCTIAWGSGAVIGAGLAQLESWVTHCGCWHCQ